MELISWSDIFQYVPQPITSCSILPKVEFADFNAIQNEIYINVPKNRSHDHAKIENPIDNSSHLIPSLKVVDILSPFPKFSLLFLLFILEIMHNYQPEAPTTRGGPTHFGVHTLYYTMTNQSL